MDIGRETPGREGSGSESCLGSPTLSLMFPPFLGWPTGPSGWGALSTLLKHRLERALPLSARDLWTGEQELSQASCSRIPHRILTHSCLNTSKDEELIPCGK